MHEPDADAVDALLEDSTAALDAETRQQALAARVPDKDTARTTLREIAEDEIARLEPLRDTLWEEQDGPARQEAEDRSLVDTSVTGAKFLRYETAGEMSLHRSMNLLIRIRKAEPEHLIAIRLDKEGRTKGPRWNGLNHEEFSVQE